MKKATTNNHQMIRYPPKNSVFAEEKGAFENISFSLKVNYVILENDVVLFWWEIGAQTSTNSAPRRPSL